MNALIRSAAAVFLMSGLALVGPALAQSAPTLLPMDEETVVNGVEVACTGIAETRADPRWTRYPVRVEFANARAEYLIGAAVTVRNGKGREVLSVSCNAPWVLMRLPAGGYKVEARMLNSAAKPRTAKVTPPAKGQIRVVLRFPDA